MRLKTKTGTQFEIEITGTQEEPIITMKGSVKGMRFSDGHIAASQKRTKPGVPAEADSLAFRALKNGQTAFFLIDLAPVRAAIAALPHKIYMARIVTETVDVDGDRCPITKWHFDMPGCLIKSPKTGDIIGSDRLARFLNSHEISDIEITEATRLWSDANESEEQLARKATETARLDIIQQQWAEEEEMENGALLREERVPTPYHPRDV